MKLGVEAHTHMYVISALWRRRQEDEKFKVIFSYVATLRLAEVM